MTFLELHELSKEENELSLGEVISYQQPATTSLQSIKVYKLWG